MALVEEYAAVLKIYCEEKGIPYADFRAAFEERIFEIADTCFDAQEMSDYIDDYIEKMPKILEHSWARFYGSENDKDTVFYELMEDHRTFFNERREMVEAWFE